MSKTLINVDKDFRIEVDPQNWTVYQQREGEKSARWYVVGYCHDLPAALRCIIRTKTSSGFDTGRITDYLSWYEANVHSMLDRVLRKDTELKEALGTNQLIISPNNFN